MSFKQIFSTTLLSTALLTAQSSIGLNINDKDIEFYSAVDLDNLTDSAGGTGYVLDFSFLHADKKENIAMLGFSGQNSVQGLYGLTLALGAKLISAEDFTALPMMVRATYALPISFDMPATSLIGTLAYAPSVLSFSDAKNYTESRVELDMEMIPSIHLFTGYRNIDTNYKEIDYSFNNSFYGGMKLSF